MSEVRLTVKAIVDNPNFVLGHSVSPYTWYVQVGQALSFYTTKEAL